MHKSDPLLKLFAILGVILTCLSSLVPLVSAILRSIDSRSFLLDLDIPIWLYLLWLLGGGILIWVAYQARRHTGGMIADYVLSVLLLVAYKILGTIQGIHSMTLNVFQTMVYISLLFLAIDGIKLLRSLYKLSMASIGN